MNTMNYGLLTTLRKYTLYRHLHMRGWILPSLFSPLPFTSLPLPPSLCPLPSPLSLSLLLPLSLFSLSLSPSSSLSLSLSFSTTACLQHRG